jgi:AcrR family transcriptional regulator
MASGLRHQRKQRTRDALSEAAMALFAKRGFDEVTISEIAHAAGVSKMTVTNYFPRKEDLVFDQAEATIRSLADAVAARARGESLLTAIRRDCMDRIAAGDVTLGPPSAVFARIVDDSRVLTHRAREIADLRERALGDAIAAETGEDDLRLRVIATQLASVHRGLFTETSRRVLAGEPRDAVFAELAATARGLFDLMESSLGEYCRKRDVSPTPAEQA